MAKTSDLNDYPTDYLDIVNEINDFIASLDAPPLDNHTKELVGTSDKLKFGQHGVADDVPTSDARNGQRSRHASGEKNTSQGLSLPRQPAAFTDGGDDPCDKTLPFPLLEEGSYDYVGSDRSKVAEFADYSDSSNYGGDLTDSDSGCYSHYQQLPYSDDLAGHKDTSLGGYSSSPRLGPKYPSFCSPTSPLVSGNDRGTAFLPASSSPTLSSPSSSRHFPQHIFSSSVRPQSPDRLSAEFHCDPGLDSADPRFHQLGSSAHTISAASGRSQQFWDPSDHSYQEPSNTPKVPDSPVPRRRSPVKQGKFEGSHVSPTTSYPLSTSPKSAEHVREGSYSTIQKPTGTTSSPGQNSPQKLNIKNRWPPPADSGNESLVQDAPLGKVPGSSRRVVSKEKPALKETPFQERKQHAEKESGISRQHPIPIPITRVPDLSILISELRSASPKSDLSPSSNYTTTARSESASPKHQPLSDVQSPYPSTKAESASCPKPEAESWAHPPSSSHLSRAQSQSPSHQPHNRTLSPSSPRQQQPVNGVRCKSDSPEHDYEPIENLQLEVPATPRPQTKFPHPPPAMASEAGGQPPKHVKALHNFKGTNNDELCFKKGDIITVTQCVDGGWWEGTLNGRTGWFPSNYTKEIKADISYKHKSGDVPVYKRESMQLYHNVVLKNVIETEKTHVSEMLKVLQSYIKPIEATNILTPPEYTLLVGNLEEIIAFQQSFLAALEECEKLPSSQRRIGGIFMQFAPEVKELYSSYCANHPKAVSVLQKKRDELSKFVETQGAPSPGAQTLTTILSKPFTRLDKYPSLLKELERHVEESHPDRGDTQRAIAVYRNIANSCLEIRKMKEMEHEIVTSTIQGWEGEDMSKLGEVIHLSQVKIHMQTGEKYERIFVLFAPCLVMLSMSSRLSSYQYEGKIPLSGLNVTPCENADSTQDAFEISGPMIEKITVLCGTKTEVAAWLDILNHQLAQAGNPPSSSSSSSSKPQPLQVHMISSCQQPSVSTVTPAKTAQISSNNPPTAPPPHFPSNKTSSVWSLTCLRPSPPLRPTLMCREEVLKSPRAVRKTTQKRKPVRTYSGDETDWHNKNDPKVYNEDAFILQVIEAYCNSVKTRHTVNSCRIEVAKKKPNEGKAILNSPQILLAEEEKIFDETDQQERTVVDTVYALQDRVKELEQEQRKLRQDLEEEKRCRKKLEVLVRQQVIKSAVVDGVQDCGS